MSSLFFEEWYDNTHGEMVVGLAFGYVADFSILNEEQRKNDAI
jgi:hypothetical protein